MGDKLAEYCRLLSQCVSQDPRAEPDTAEEKGEECRMNPGDQVLVKLSRKSNLNLTGPDRIQFC
uniref:Uncharacterized protein n=1 Tax=Anguilla anguilla TaxID=7936 RepID=A0A0E9W8K6_ANGAN